MKKVLVFLATVGLASATPISLNTVLNLAASDLESIPTGTVAIPAFSVPTTGGAHGGGGLCPGAFTTCPSSGGIVAGTVLTFTLSQASVLNIILQDKYSVGDVYEVILNSGSTGTSSIGEFTSSIVSFGGTTAQGCWTSAANSSVDNSCLNVETGALAAGNYSITVWDIMMSYIGSGDPFGGGTIPNNGGEDNGQLGANPASYSPATFQLTVDASGIVIPEPSTLALFGLGGIGLGLIRRRIAK
jgi:hypothetical protein